MTMAVRKSCGVPSVTRRSNRAAGTEGVWLGAGSLEVCRGTSRTSKAVSRAIIGITRAVSNGRGGGGETTCGNGGGFVFSGGNGETRSGRIWRCRVTTFGGVVPGGCPSASRKRRTRSSSVWVSPPRGMGRVTGAGGCGAGGLCGVCVCDFAFDASQRTSATNTIRSRKPG